MSLIRPEIVDGLRKGHEVIAALLVVVFGLWLIWLGGLILVPIGGMLCLLGGFLARLSWQRMRFARAVGAPGVVELDEGQVGYLTPDLGGFLSLAELIEIRLITVSGRRMWRLRQTDGQALLIPIDAKGAEGLFDAFANLPGMDTSALVAALDAPLQTSPTLAETRVIWRKQTGARVTRP